MIATPTTSGQKIIVADTRQLMGQMAAEAFVKKINELLLIKAEVNIVFAAAPSQNEFLAALLTSGVDWQRVNAFHMDEYVGLDASAPQGFGNFLRDRLFGHAQFRSVHYLNGNAVDIDAECKRYTDLLTDMPVDMVAMGIGENGHLAFNDPPVADFQDKQIVKVVALDEACRQQQVNDGCFDTIDTVPTHALTLTIPALIKAPHIYCIVPGPLKANAVYNTFNQPMVEAYPSTILRQHTDCTFFFDVQSAALLNI
ncbi:glucosamine-6-phosphate deaminase [Mucilaginibacter sp. JRF]|uniref:glucosamine-6-phosphate deaminase n=1 Tax=Mucilaginibacter sp. JRF TaxID=2780088 RepID=UPI0018827E56|nr:glucosamine-6-phosphate deaminase [Mucilaginibacter sp. JRF]MBE9583100.1 glucosamine-6-phosphate deaminase [Mucilaginibacter sp. JRF]